MFHNSHEGLVHSMACLGTDLHRREKSIGISHLLHLRQSHTHTHKRSGSRREGTGERQWQGPSRRGEEVYLSKVDHLLLLISLVHQISLVPHKEHWNAIVQLCWEVIVQLTHPEIHIRPRLLLSGREGESSHSLCRGLKKVLTLTMS